MSDQPESAKPPPPQDHAPGNQLRESAYWISRNLALSVLEYIFKTLALLNTAYLHMHPNPPHQHQAPCSHVLSRTGPTVGIGMTGQGERLAYVGILLRTAQLICDIRGSVSDPLNFHTKIKELKKNRLKVARGVAMLNFLAAGLCRNDRQTPFNLLKLVQALRSNDSCRRSHNLSGPINILQVYNKAPSNRILTLINILLDQCRVCASMERVKELKEKLGANLDPSKYHGCGDCELMLLDILMYTRMLPKAYHRMLASLRLSFDYDIDLRRAGDCQKETVDKQFDNGLKEIHSRLSKLGLTEISVRKFESPDGHLLTESMECEVMFMSGWQEEEEKKDAIRLLHDSFQEQRKRRLFYIQCRYQYQRQQAQGNQQGIQQQRRRCCEPQMQKCLKRVASELGDAHQMLTELVPVAFPKMRVHMMLEQDPCEQCNSMVLPNLLKQLDQLRYHEGQQRELFTMLPFEKHSPLTFLERMTPLFGQGPVRLKDDLKPFEERHVCMIRGRCRGVRCYGHCQYSTPSNALAMTRLRSHKLIPRQYELPNGIVHRWWSSGYDYTLFVKGAYVYCVVCRP